MRSGDEQVKVKGGTPDYGNQHQEGVAIGGDNDRVGARCPNALPFSVSDFESVGGAGTAAGSLARGAAYMLAFALGTAPAMLLFGSLGALIPKKYNKYILKVSTVLIIALGLALMLKGLKLI